MISRYDHPIPITQTLHILMNRMRLEAFVINEHMEVWPDALKELSTLVATGKLKYRETVSQGLETAPEALIGMFKGKNFGKQLVKLV
jgi:NADPH-dependent curcumin reductase CurA